MYYGSAWQIVLVEPRSTLIIMQQALPGAGIGWGSIQIKKDCYVTITTDHGSTSTIANSGGSRIFPRGGREPSRGGVNMPNFPENCMKSKEFGRPGGGVRPSRPPLDPPMANIIINADW